MTYRPCARFLNRLADDQKFLHLVVGNCDTYEAFSYSDLRRVSWRPAAQAGGGPVLVLRFVEAVITDVEILGRNLEDLHYYISEGTMPWVCEQPKGFGTRDDAATVITQIRFFPVDKETGERLAAR